MSATTEPETGRRTNGNAMDDGAANPGLLDAVRGFGVMVGGPALLVAAAVGSVASVARSLARGRLPRPAPALGALAVAGYVVGVRPWHLAWGATPDEVAGGDAEGCRFEPGRALGLQGWGTIVVEPLDERRTRLVVHGSGKRGLELVYGVVLIELPHFVMERRMLLGVKERAEARA